MKNVYTVWRRSDGYVDASCRSHPLTAEDLNGKMTFEILLSTEDWMEAWSLIEKERRNEGPH